MGNPRVRFTGVGIGSRDANYASPDGSTVAEHDMGGTD